MPYNGDYAEQIGADLYGENAIEAVEVVKKLLQNSRGSHKLVMV